MGRTCRNCHDDGGDLISPCLCSGTMKWVHRSCLDTWRTVSPNKLSFSECDVCHFKYRVQKKPLGMWPRISYALKLTRDVVFVFALAIAAILIVGSIALLIERLSEYDADFDPEVREVFQNVYFQLFGIGFLGLCFVIGILAIVAMVFKSCLTCCDSCCDEPSYSYNTYSYNPCCDPWWCFMFYWWNAVYAPPGTCVCYPCCCCAFPVDDCFCCDVGNCDCDCGNCNCDCNCNDCGDCDDGRVLIVIVVIIVVIIILIGFFVGVAMFAMILSKLIKNHNKVYQKQLSACEMQVVDLDKHPEYMNDESAVVDVGEKGALTGAGAVIDIDDEEEYRKKKMEYTAPSVPEYSSYPADPYAAAPAPAPAVVPPPGTAVVPPPGTVGYAYPAGPYVDPNDHSDGYPGAVLK